MTLLELARSTLDLWHHFDSVEALRYDREGPPPVLAPFDAESARQHTAAFRALGGAAEALPLDSIDDEIDRTLVVDAIRVRLRRLERERPERENPLLWTDRLTAVLEARSGDADTIDRIPLWAAALRRTLVRSAPAHRGLALGQIRDARERLGGPAWRGVEFDRLQAASDALAEVGALLEQLEPEPAPATAAAEDQVTWQLHHGFKIEVTAAEAIRRLTRRATETAARLADQRAVPGAVPPGESDEAAIRAAIGRGPSEIRRRLVAPEAVAAWRGFLLRSAGADDPGCRWLSLGEDHVSARLGLIDLELALRTRSAEAALPELGRQLPGREPIIRRLLVAPLEATATALLAGEWDAVASRWSGARSDLIARITRVGLLHPALAAWSLGLDA